MTAGKAPLSWFDRTSVPLPCLVRVVVGGFFIYMGCVKVLDPVEFLKQINLYGMLPTEPGFYLNSTAIVMPWLEIVSGLALVLGVFIRGAAAMIALMLAVFTPAIFLRAWGIHTAAGVPFMQVAFDCGCGTGEVIIWQKLLANTGYFIASLLMLFSTSRRWCLSALFTRRRQAATSLAPFDGEPRSASRKKPDGDRELATQTA